MAFLVQAKLLTLGEHYVLGSYTGQAFGKAFTKILKLKASRRQWLLYLRVKQR
jgi:hypothetical protein